MQACHRSQVNRHPLPSLRRACLLHRITTVTPVSCPGQPSFISEELHTICAAGAHDRSAIRNVRDLLEEAPLLASARDISGQNALHLLCASHPHTAATVNSWRISPTKATPHALPCAVCDAKSSERSTFFQVEIANFLFEANKQVHVLSVPIFYNHVQLCIVAWLSTLLSYSWHRLGARLRPARVYRCTCFAPTRSSPAAL
jgi:hypothetical protein